jgi:hypothetical protein
MRCDYSWNYPGQNYLNIYNGIKALVEKSDHEVNDNSNFHDRED